MSRVFQRPKLTLLSCDISESLRDTSTWISASLRCVATLERLSSLALNSFLPPSNWFGHTRNYVCIVYVCIALPSLSSERGARCDNLPLGMLIGFCKRHIARVQQLSLRPQPARHRARLGGWSGAAQLLASHVR